MLLYMAIASLVAVALIIAVLFIISSTRNATNNYFSSLGWQNFNDNLYKQNTFNTTDSSFANCNNTTVTSYCPNCGSFTTDTRAVFCTHCGSTL